MSVSTLRESGRSSIWTKSSTSSTRANWTEDLTPWKRRNPSPPMADRPPKSNYPVQQSDDATGGATTGLPLFVDGVMHHREFDDDRGLPPYRGAGTKSRVMILQTSLL